jgi:Ca2+-binding EF-hand superfamily protein
MSLARTPSLAVGVAAVAALDKYALDALRSLREPPPAVVAVCKAVAIILDRPNENWADVQKKTLSDRQLLQALQAVDSIAELKPKQLELLQEIVDEQKFTVEEMGNKSQAAGALCAWVIGFCEQSLARSPVGEATAAPSATVRSDLDGGPRPPTTAQPLVTPRTKEAKAVFKALDANSDGGLTLSEMQLKMADFGVADDQIEQLFIAMDANHDGCVSLDEFIAGYRQVLMFQSLDADRDGKLELSEALTGETVAASAAGKSELDLQDLQYVSRMYANMDADENGSVSLAEFVSATATEGAKWVCDLWRQGWMVFHGPVDLQYKTQDGAWVACTAVVAGKEDDGLSGEVNAKDAIGQRIFCAFLPTTATATTDAAGDAVFDESNHALTLEDIALSMERREGHTNFGEMRLTVSAALHPEHQFAGKTVCFRPPPFHQERQGESAAAAASASASNAAIVQELMAPFADWVSSGVHENASLDKLTLGKIAPEAKQAVASFPGEERGLWTLLLRAPPAYCERAFGEETVSLCPVYSYANDWWAAWRDNIRKAISLGQKLLVYTRRDFANRYEPKDRDGGPYAHWPGKILPAVKQGDPINPYGASQLREIEWLEAEGIAFEVRPVETVDALRAVGANGDVYEGPYDLDGRRHGHGKYAYAAGGYYEGDFVHDAMHGTGVMVDKLGGRYDGLFEDGCKHGRGVFVGHTGQRLDGLWEANAMKAGTIVGASGDRIETLEGGSFDRKYKLNGPGKRTSGDECFTGELKNSLFHGKGTLVCPTQTIECDTWENGMPCGAATVVQGENTLDVVYEGGKPTQCTARG